MGSMGFPPMFDPLNWKRLAIINCSGSVEKREKKKVEEEEKKEMSLRIKAVVDKFVEELKEALEADIQDRRMKEREMQSYIEEREREVAEREAAWKAQLSRREVRFLLKMWN